MKNLLEFVRAHGLPAEEKDGMILTRDEYITPDKVFHSDAILLPANEQVIREWLGY